MGNGSLSLRPLGHSGLAVTPLGLGLAALGRPGYITLDHAADLRHDYSVETMQARAHAVLDAAWAAGIRYFDAARSYGKAEQFLGTWLHRRNIPPEAVTVGSKWGYTYTANWQVEAKNHEIKDHSLPVLKRQWEETRANLGRHVRLYQVHSATLDSGVLENIPVLQQLWTLKHHERVRIGLTLSGPEQAATLRRAAALTVGGARLFDTVQVTYNVLEPSTGPLLEEVHAAGMGVIVKEALANGRLTPRNADNPDFARAYAVLQAQAERLRTTVDALALAAVLACPFVDVVLSGAARQDHLTSNLGALRVAWDEEADSALAALAEPPDQYWATRSALDWN
ncbi:MAG: aldo/keto reductase [Anaerolineae bacterium]|nr:aldo/keto reductase [Anaerolineae bacterium]